MKLVDIKAPGVSRQGGGHHLAVGRVRLIDVERVIGGTVAPSAPGERFFCGSFCPAPPGSGGNFSTPQSAAKTEAGIAGGASIISYRRQFSRRSAHSSSAQPVFKWPAGVLIFQFKNRLQGSGIQFEMPTGSRGG